MKHKFSVLACLALCAFACPPVNASDARPAKAPDTSGFAPEVVKNHDVLAPVVFALTAIPYHLPASCFVKDSPRIAWPATAEIQQSLEFRPALQFASDGQPCPYLLPCPASAYASDNPNERRLIVNNSSAGYSTIYTAYGFDGIGKRSHFSD